MTKPRVALDTNILFSSILYKGKPRQVFDLVIEQVIVGVSSPILLAELSEALLKKSRLSLQEVNSTIRELEEDLIIICPVKSLDALRDKDDNRVLEAAAEGGCSYVVTGDKDLLTLGKFKNIKIVTASQFLELIT